jgi:hypothetical protein
MKAHKVSKEEQKQALALCTAWKESGAASNRYKVDKANVLLTALSLSATRMKVAPAPLAERREAVKSGAVEAFTAEWDALVEGESRPDQKVQRRLMSALALTGAKVRLDWVCIGDTFYIVRTG